MFCLQTDLGQTFRIVTKKLEKEPDNGYRKVSSCLWRFLEFIVVNSPSRQDFWNLQQSNMDKNWKLKTLAGMMNDLRASLIREVSLVNIPVL